MVVLCGGILRMCRSKTPNINPFNPFRAGLAPEVKAMIIGIRQAGDAR